MNEMIHVNNSSYSRYEELLIRRDNLKKEAFHWDKEYIRVFGDKILKIFEIKVTCIKKKKTISFCQAVLNRGGKVDQEELQKYIEEETAAYKEQLDIMIEESRAAKDTSHLSEVAALEVRELDRLNEEKQKILVTLTEDKGRQEKKAEFINFLHEQTTEFEEFDDGLVGRLIDQITVHESGTYTVEFKSGTMVEV